VFFVFAMLLAAHGKDVFAVQRLTAMIGCTAAPVFPVVDVDISAADIAQA
jgi:hypothetical protein